MLLQPVMSMILLPLGLVAACVSAADQSQERRTTEPDYGAARTRMVDDQIRGRGVSDRRVLEAMRRVPRERFVPVLYRAEAYADHPLPIGYEQTISQPFIVGWMTQALKVSSESRVLEIGTGSGYQAAVLGEIVRDVYTIEIVEALAKSATETLRALGYRNVHVRHGDGYKGWPEQAPFDAIIVTAAPDHVPQPLVDQLKEGGRLVIPVGREVQFLSVITKTRDGIVASEKLPVRFVPLTREEPN